MGTNFYYLERNPNHKYGNEIQKMIEPSYRQLRIGESSGGWVFSLRLYSHRGINSLQDWKNILDKDGSIVIDEYYNTIQVQDLYGIIENRGVDRTWEDLEMSIKDLNFSLENYLAINNAIKGPNNLMRYKIDGDYCVGHGEGTWDYIKGEFT